MKASFLIKSIFLGLILLLSACADYEKKPIPADQTQVVTDWEKVSPDFNPQTDTIEFKTSGVNKLFVDIFSFMNDVEIAYAETGDSEVGALTLYRVSKGTPDWGTLDSQLKQKTLDLKMLGNYTCSITIKDGKIEQLQGGCYVKLRITLPKGSEIEVYNVGKLLSKRFVVITSEEFLESLLQEPLVSKKLLLVQEFLRSYIGTEKRPILSCDQLEIALDEFKHDHRLNALKKLHRTVADRKELRALITRIFTGADRATALQIIGAVGDL